MTDLSSLWGRVLFSALGGLTGALEVSIPLMLIVFLAVILDAVTAWRLSRRARRAGAKASGKFKSSHFGRVLYTLWLVFMLIFLAAMMQQFSVFGVHFPLANFVMMAVAFWQIWSILENESSCNGAKWAVFLQRVMVDKTSRHLDLDIDKALQETKDHGKA